MSDTTWDTDEVERWIDNDEHLYNSINDRNLSASAIRAVVMNHKRAVPDFKFDTSLVSWKYLRDAYWKETE